ncbi:Vacuolar protein sorting-associated protein 13 [Dispira simplex]|nr:Vacuolar protein sorting-associated protein 13 [Dispira simplex]
MFEAIVANLLNKFLGDYVANLETDQLKIGIWHGDVKLNNLQLRKEALDKFNLPIDVHEGYIGELVLKIPWSNLKGEPVRVLLKNIFVLAGPKRLAEYDPEEDEQRRQRRKQDKLETLEMLSTKPKPEAENDAKQTSFTMQLVTKIVDNLQISIHNIHIRYEDDLSNPEHLFAAGITLSELSAMSTDEFWRVRFIEQPMQSVFKLLRMGHLAVYFNPNTTSLAGQSLPDFLQSFSDLISDENRRPKDQMYILKPVSGMGRLILNKKFTPITPKSTATFLFDQLAFVLDEIQYKDLLLLVSSFDYSIRQHRYLKFRPPAHITISDNPRQWLQFAIECVLSEVRERRRRWTWDYFKERRKDRQRYMRLYRELQANPNALEEKKELMALERKLSFQDIRFYRSRVEAMRRKERAVTAKQPGPVDTRSWVGSWFGTWSGGSTTPHQTQLSEEQIQELYDTIEFDEKEVILDYDLPKECVLLEVNMQLNKGSFTVKQAGRARASQSYHASSRSHSKSRQTLMSMNFDTFRFGFTKHPSSFVANLSLHSFNILDGTTENSLYPYLVNVQGDPMHLVSPAAISSTLNSGRSDNPSPVQGEKGEGTHPNHLMSSELVKSFQQGLPLPAVYTHQGLVTALDVPLGDEDGNNDNGSQVLPKIMEESEDSKRPDEASETSESVLVSQAPDSPTSTNIGESEVEPFFTLVFESNPLDARANSALTLKSQRLNFFFNPDAIETMAKFFRPPVPALDSVHTLILAAGKSMEGFKQQTRAGLQFALEAHKTMDIQVDLDAPIFIIPSSFTDPHAIVTVLDSGRLKVHSNLVAQERIDEGRKKEGKELTEEELEDLKSLMYDRFILDLSSAQLVVGQSVDKCLEALQDTTADQDGELHVVNRINVQFNIGVSILPQYPGLPKVLIDGHLPLLKLNFSDRKYKALMKFVDMLDFLDRLDEDPVPPVTPANSLATRRDPSKIGGDGSDGPILGSTDNSTGAPPTSSSTDSQQDINLSPQPLDLYSRALADHFRRVHPGQNLGLSGIMSKTGSPQWVQRSRPQYSLRELQVADCESDREIVLPEDASDSGSDPNEDDDEFFDAEAGQATDQPGDDLHIRLNTLQVVLGFTIGELSASLRRSHRDIEVPETYLAELRVKEFSLNFTKRPLDMAALVYVRSLEIEDRMQHGTYLLTTAKSLPTPSVFSSPPEEANLLRVEYKRVDPTSPEFITQYEGMRQSVEVNLFNVNINIIRGSILTLYDFILKTFVPSPGTPTPPPPRGLAGQSPSSQLTLELSPQGTRDDPATVRVRVGLSEINLILNNDRVQLGTLSLSHADIAVLVRDRTLRVGAKLGKLTLTDDCAHDGTYVRPEYRTLLAIEGEELANFSYETFDATSPAKYPGFDAALYLRVGAARVTVAEEPLHALIEFGSKFAQMHVLFEAARRAAAEQATQLQEHANRFHFTINIKSPVLVFPEQVTRSDVIVAHLGEVNFENRFVEQCATSTTSSPVNCQPTTTARSTGTSPEPIASDSRLGLLERLASVGPHYLPPMASGTMGSDGYFWNPNVEETDSQSGRTALSQASPLVNRMYLHVSSIKLVSVLYFDQLVSPQELPIINDLDLRVAMNYLEYQSESYRPELEITAKLSDVHMQLTERQYRFLLHLTTALSRTFATTSDAAAENEAFAASLSGLNLPNAPELSGRPGKHPHWQEGDGESYLSEDSFTYPEIPTGHYTTEGEVPVPNVKPPLPCRTFSSGASDTQYTTLDLVFNLETIDLEVFRGDGTQGQQLSDVTFSRFCSQDIVVKHKITNDSRAESEVQIHSFTVQDTRPQSKSQFRDILPKADHQGPQLLARVDASPGEDRILIATVDHPRVILDLNHIYAMRDYFMSPYHHVVPGPDTTQGAPPDYGMQKDRFTTGVSDQRRSISMYQLTSQPKAPQGVNETSEWHDRTRWTRPSSHKAANRERVQSEGGIGTSRVHGAESGGGPAETTGFAFRVNVVSPEILLLADASSSQSEAVVLRADQVVVAQQGIFALTVEQVEMSLCRMDRREDTTVKFIDNFDVVLSMHNGSSRTDHMLTNIIVDVKPLVLRVSYEDIALLLEIFNKATQLSEGSPTVPSKPSSLTHTGAPTPPTTSPIRPLSGESSPVRATSMRMSQESPSSEIAVGHPELEDVSLSPPSRESATPTSSRPTTVTKRLTVSREIMKLAFQGLQVVLIGNKIDIPVVDLNFDAFSVNLTDWSTQLKVDVNLRTHANYFNIQSSHWEPLVEPWQFGVHVQLAGDSNSMTRIDVHAKHRLDINISHAFIETLLNSVSELTRDKDNYLYRTRTEHIPYRIKNQTGSELYVWHELPNKHRDQTTVTLIKDQESLPWRFGDWHRSRDVLTASRNKIGIQFTQVQLESLKDIPVDREGSKLYRLRPRVDDISHRLAVDVRLRHDVKEVVLRSSLVFENRTLVPLRLGIVDHQNKFITEPAVVDPGEDWPVPILYCHRYAVRVRPVDGYNYCWSKTYIYWMDFLTKTPPSTVSCKSELVDTPDFVLQIHGRYRKKDVAAYQYPFMTIRLCAPIEIENVLPYDVIYTVVDKATNREWKSRLIRSGIAPVHVVRPGHLLLMSLQVPNTPYRRSRFAVIDASSHHGIDVDDQLSLIDDHGRELPLRLDRRVIPDSGGAHVVSIYVPYIMLNQTGLSMQLKAKSLIKSAAVVAGQGPEGIRGGNHATPFMFSYESYEPRNRCLVRFAGGDWSKPLSFEAVGSLAEVAIPSTNSATHSTLHVGISVEPGPGRYSRTKMVTFTPRYVLKNTLDQELNFREVGSPRSTRLGAHQRAPLHFVHQLQEKQLTINFPGLNNFWSAPFLIDQVGELYVKLNTTRLERVLIRVDIVLEGPCIFILFSKVEGAWPYRIENFSETEVTLYQYDPSLREAPANMLANSTLVKKYRLPPGRTMSYSWDYPSMKEKQLVLNVRGRERKVDIQQIGTLVPFKFASSTVVHNTLSLDVIADQTVQVLRITPYNQNKSIFKPRLQRKGTLREAFEIASVRNVTTLSFRLRLEGIGVSIINAKLQELLYATFRGIELKFTDSTCSQSINWIIDWIQFDNQLYGGLNEIVLYPTIIPKGGQEAEMRHVLHVALVRAKDESYGEMSLEMDEDFLFSLVEFSKFDGTERFSQVKAKEDQLCETVAWLPDPSIPEDQVQLYFEILHIQPLKFNLSFVRTQRINQELDPWNTQNPLMVLSNAFTMAVGNVNDAPIKLNALVIENVRANTGMLLDRFARHYGQEALYQIHKILGSADVIGNPVGLFNTISSGVADFFYEPYQGFVMSDRPQDFGIGLARGTYSLFSKTVYGVSDSFSKFAESVSKGLSVATLDKHYQDRRRMSRTRNRPRHALYGVSQGATSLASSVASGITGVVMQPLQGAEKEGVGGFFKGVGKGLVGVVTKPMVGVFDLASHVTEGIKNTTTVFNSVDLDRVRLPRFVAREGILHVYNQRDALGQYWLKQIDNGEYFYETYLAHLELRGSEMVALVTYSKLMMIKSRSLSVEWAIPLSALQSINLEAKGISVVLRNDEMGPFIPIPEASSRRWLYRKLAEAVKELTQRKIDD